MEHLIEKLNQINDSKKGFDDWTLEEQKRLLDIYLIFSKKEASICKLIYSYHGCDSWEDIFRDYDIQYLEDKAFGIEIAIQEITEQINRKPKK
jgi:hypothetical protein